MQSHEIRQRFLDFFKKRGHALLPSASLVPENDPSVLFNTAGMQPLVPYLMGQKHPMGNRLASCQKCVRTGDLEDIGDNRHFSFFEMLGNWSLGDYFKKEAITWSYEFLTNGDDVSEGDRGLGSVITLDRLFVTIFNGDENAPFDQESKDIWMSLGIPEHRIYALPADDNWWSPGDNGPCGPCTEMFFDMQGVFVGKELSREAFIEEVKKESIIEIWNDVFMEYEKKDGKVIGKLTQKNVDTGAGLERLTAVMQGKQTAYDTDIFVSIIENIIKTNIKKEYNEKSVRIIADHIRTATFMIADGVVPANKDRGYILRRLIRRAFVQTDRTGLDYSVLFALRESYASKYENTYSVLKENGLVQHEIFKDEIEKFKKTLHQGLHEFEKGCDAFTLATTYGFPIELTEELAREQGRSIDRVDFDEKMAQHQQLSRTASAGMFKGGLADHSDATVKLHTAHHLLLAALQKHVSADIHQRGSNITAERLRMDFSFDRKLTDDEKRKVEDQVNEWIQAALSVSSREMSLDEAKKLGAEMEFSTKYGERETVYVIETTDTLSIISKEFCGGPHVTNTAQLGTFHIQKEEASSAGIRRIKAILV